MIKVRDANRWDQSALFNMLRDFREATPIEAMSQCNNEEHVSQLFHMTLVGGGITLIAEKDNQPIGFIIGVIENTIWDGNFYVLREVAYWVDPEHRGSSAGYRLLHEYNRQAKLLKEEKRINVHTMSKLINSPDLDYSKFGFRKVEEIWVAE